MILDFTNLPGFSTTTTINSLITSTINSPCQCLCAPNGESIIPLSCYNKEQALNQCKCRIKAIRKGICEMGYSYHFKENLCYGMFKIK